MTGKKSKQNTNEPLKILILSMIVKNKQERGRGGCKTESRSQTTLQSLMTVRSLSNDQLSAHFHHLFLHTVERFK